MHIALWDIPPVDTLFIEVPAQVSVPLEVERHDAKTCTSLLLQEQVDVALLPSIVVLSNTDVFEVLPGAVFSTWAYPYARLLLRREMAHVETIAYARSQVLEALVARIVLREHYGNDPTFVPLDDVTTEDLLNADQDASLIVGPDALTLQTEHMVLNLGQEWYELANYPMVWGLFATLSDAASPVMFEVIMAAVRAAEQLMPQWVQARAMSPELHTFYTEGLRFRFDDLTTASLTELRQYLYYYNITEDLPELPLYELPEDWEDDANEVPLL